jgi:hypothetical protein
MLSPLAYLKLGDGVILLFGLILTAWLATSVWNGAAADKVIIRSGGKIFREVPLSRNQNIEVPGPLGISLVAIYNRQARIAADPSPRQYCVRQGWLKLAGEISVCLPNQVSVELNGGSKHYDSLNY